MSLNAGATLQNQKYVIQELLHQSDFGVTYQAQHAYLEQPVVLQTLNESLRQRSDFAQLRQQFFQNVRSLTQQASKARVLDCFEESDFPYVVFELSPGQAPPQLRDWFPLSPQINPPGVSTQESPDSLLAAHAAGLNTAAETQLPEPAVSHNLDSATAVTQVPSVIATAVATLRMARPHATDFPRTGVSQLRRFKGWMPLALLSMSTVGGLLGAGFGLSLRLTPAPKADTANTANTTNFSPRFFSREQSFPSEADWPISETPQLFMSDPLPVEEPVYRVSPPLNSYSQPEYQPLPSETQLEPVQPPSQPKTVAPSKPILPDFAAPLPGLPELPSAPPAISNPPVPAAPVEPAPPLLPELPPAPAAPAPLPNTAPAAPALPINEPPAIKQ